MATLLTQLLSLSLLLLATTPSPASSARCNPTDKQTLIRINANLGLYWPNTTGCCDWFGIDCDPVTSRVTGLSMFGYGDTFTLPDAIADLPFLKSLDLHKTNLTGPIPSFIGKLTKLTFLRLDWSSLTGPIPAFLSHLTALYYINLSFNRLTGSIPASLAGLPGLVYLRLDRNRLTGPIPEALARLQAETVYLSHNNLTGPLPGSFAQAVFQDLDLSRNRLTGDASVLFGAKKALQQLDLSRNLFEFDLTTVVLPSGLGSLDVNHNKIYGSISKQFSQLSSLNVSYNRLCGEIPIKGDLDAYNFFHNKCLCGPPLDPCK